MALLRTTVFVEYAEKHRGIPQSEDAVWNDEYDEGGKWRG
jgi:hypothetical protein